MRTLGVIEGETITEHDDERVTFTSKAAIDGDGAPTSHGDPCWQPSTSLYFQGKPINSDTVPYVVVPPVIVRMVRGIVLGCRALVTNTLNNQSCVAVVADIGPGSKLGEISIAAATRLGLNPSPTEGGTSEHVINYTIWPGLPAVVQGIEYTLQPYR